MLEAMLGLTCEAPLGLFQVLLRMLKKAKSRVSVRLTKLTKKVFFELTKQNYISPEKTALTSNTLLRFSFFTTFLTSPLEMSRSVRITRMTNLTNQRE